MNIVTDKNSSAPIQLPRVYRGKKMSIISVTGGKGGVGKSSVAANLAVALSDMGGRVLLVDGDLAMANADQMLGVHVATNLWSVINSEATLEDAVVKTPWGVSIVCASSGRTEMAELNEVARRDLLEGLIQIGQNFDYIVIDTAAGIGGVALDFAAIADHVLAVATPDPASVRDVFAIMKVLSKERKVDKINLIANMVSSSREGMDLFKRIAGVAARFLPLNLRLGGVVMKDPIMQKAIRERLPVNSVYPESTAARQISRIASQILVLDRENDQAAVEQER